MNELSAARDSVAELCRRYERQFETSVSAILSDQLKRGDDLWNRRNFTGHLTGSAIVLNDKGEALLVKHKFLGLWLAPGGHADPFELPADTAARELAEEAGLTAFALHPWHQTSGIPIDVNSHPIPENPGRGEASHLHHDFRYVFTSTAASSLQIRPQEVEASSWQPLTSLESEYPDGYRRIRALGMLK